MSSRIFLIQGEDELIELEEQDYDSEDLLQRLLAQYPNLLAGEPMNRETPRRWLLIARETAVPFEEAGSVPMSLDHLFLDQDGIPTLVEVKRSSDTRIRREVVGQMLDYAANAVVGWRVEEIRARFEAYCENQDLEPEQKLFEDLGLEGDEEEYWERVKTNLRAGKIRLIFVADVIPSELRTIIEFLNRQMDPAQVMGVEIKQYVGQDLRTLVPRLIGVTEEAQQKKVGSGRGKKKWNRALFFPELEARHGPEDAAVARKILEWSQGKVTRVWWGQGDRNGSFVPILRHKDRDHQLFAVWTYGTVEIYFYWYGYKPPFDDESKKKELWARLNSIDGVSIPIEVITKRPGIKLEAFRNPVALEKLLNSYDWFIEEVKAS